MLRELVHGDTAKASIDARISTPGDEFAGVPPQWRLVLRERDRNFFRDNVQTQGSLRSFVENNPNQGNLSDSQKRLLENTKYIYNEFCDTDNSDIRDFATFTTQSCHLVIVSTSDQDAAYRIFSVMNNRGLDLSPVDILKADIIGKIPEKEQIDEYTAQWENTEDSLGRENFEYLFGHIRMIYTKEKPRQALDRDIPEIVKRSGSAMNFIDKVLLPYADCYETVCNASFSGGVTGNDVDTYLQHLGRLKNKDWQPPAMAFLKRKKNEDIVIRFMRDLDRLAYALFITKANINERIARYAYILRDIDKKADLFGDDSPLQLAEPERIDVKRALRETINLQPTDLKTLLLRLDSMFTDKGAKYDREVITVEHVLPRKPANDSQWISWFPDEEVRNQWVNRLANMVLLSRRANSAARNFEFGRKKREYFQKQKAPPFALTTQVLHLPEWTLEALESRQELLCERIEEVWRL